MPLINQIDRVGPFYKYGLTGKKYYYNFKDQNTRKIAKKKAIIQGYAIRKSQEYKEYQFI